MLRSPFCKMTSVQFNINRTEPCVISLFGILSEIITTNDE